MFGRAFDSAEYASQPPSDAYARDLLARESIVILAAFAAGAVVGGLVAYEFDKFEQERRELYIYDLAVAQEWRRQGVATALIEASRAEARQRGVWAMYVQADYGDDPAIALYQKQGEREDVLHFDLAVDRG